MQRKRKKEKKKEKERGVGTRFLSFFFFCCCFRRPTTTQLSFSIASSFFFVLEKKNSSLFLSFNKERGARRTPAPRPAPRPTKRDRPTHTREMARSSPALAAIALVALVATAASAAPLLSDSLGAGWESRWTHSSDAKYSGRFKSAEKGDGVQVRNLGWRERDGGKEIKERHRKKGNDLKAGREEEASSSLFVVIFARCGNGHFSRRFVSVLEREMRSKWCFCGRRG